LERFTIERAISGETIHGLPNGIGVNSRLANTQSSFFQTTLMLLSYQPKDSQLWTIESVLTTLLRFRFNL
jgi:hypothetical protein